MSDTADLFRDLATHDREQRSARRDAEALKVNEYSLSGPHGDVEWFGRYHVRISVGRGERRRVADYWPATGRWMTNRSERAHHGDFEDVREWLEGGDAP